LRIAEHAPYETTEALNDYDHGVSLMIVHCIILHSLSIKCKQAHCLSHK